MPLSNLRGSRMARADVCSLPLANNAMHSTTIIVFVGRGRGKLSVTRVFFYVEKHWDWFYSPLYEVAGCPLWRGYERTELYAKTIGTCEFVRYNAVSVVEGCPLSGVPL